MVGYGQSTLTEFHSTNDDWLLILELITIVFIGDACMQPIDVQHV